MGKARIKLIGKSPKELDEVCNQIVEIAKATGVEMKLRTVQLNGNIKRAGLVLVIPSVPIPRWLWSASGLRHPSLPTSRINESRQRW